ncbi:hypothetical protein EYF80_042745 [Liparis tanakae]|uniref:Uncharacterized protein n=1 Tax=Liparis tanakae TaxID=230148 RepID=A0A4Z2G1B8_9TELE|nr:hypothetical protein EYF80_042745 [Liparis tanakae]
MAGGGPRAPGSWLPAPVHDGKGFGLSRAGAWQRSRGQFQLEEEEEEEEEVWWRRARGLT